ncbi:MAG TPA: stage III sporulation protein AE [Clostridiaceae bacterium]|nr:stage III sporulation protein AE [Clostridiaceae bacterium]
MFCTNKRYLKKIVLVTAVLVIILCSAMPVYCQEEEHEGSFPEDYSEEIIDEQMQSDEVGTITEQLEKYSGEDIYEIIENYDPRTIISDTAKGKFDFSLKGLVNGVLRYFFKEIIQNIHIMIKLIILAVLCAILKNLQTSFLSESVGEMAFYACYAIVISVVLVSFNSALKMSVEVIDKMVGFMYATVPALITLLVSGGNITSGGIFQPALIMVSEISAILIKNIFIPLIFLSTVLSIINNISDKVQISKLAAFIKQISGWSLGFILTVFVAIVSIQGSLGAVIDGVASKTAKYAIGIAIPVAGKYLADAADTVIGCTLLLKNAAGVAAMIGVLAICIGPILKIAVIVVMYKLTAALVEPIADKRISTCVGEVGNAMTFVLGICASVAFMFFVTITAIISAGNLSAMIR